MKQESESFRLSFKEKIELAKLLDKLGADIIELKGISNTRVDSLQIKSIASAVTFSRIAVPVELSNDENIEKTWAALKEAKKPRLQVCAAASDVQIEYLFHKKPEAMIEAIRQTVKKCKSLCADVEFVADDATRSDGKFLSEAITAAVEAGAGTVTLCDTAGAMLPLEFKEFVRRLYESTPTLSGVTLGISVSNAISMADACAVEAVSEGAGQISVAAYPINCVSLASVARILSAKSDTLNATSNIRSTELQRIIDRIVWVCHSEGARGLSSITLDDDSSELFLTSHDGIEAVSAMVSKLGYDLSEEDTAKVYAAFREIADKKERVGKKELDAIVASSAMQVPQAYKLDTYVITSGNTISATAHIKLTKNGHSTEGVYIGDGSIDAAFQAIEKITGCHYELDDFQLQAVTEGREAMGQTVVKLRSGGKVYSGRGISTDIVGAGIQAYLSALNKIIYEEEVE